MSDLKRITVWVCDECGYWRDEERTGVHQTANPKDPNGAMVTHTLREATYVPAPAEEQETA